MDQSQQPSIMQRAAAIQAAHTKKAVEQIARRMGWRGDPARTAMIDMCVYVAQAEQREQGQQLPGQQSGEAQQSGEQEQQPEQSGQSESGDSGEQDAGPQSGEQQSGEQQSGEQQLPSPDGMGEQSRSGEQPEQQPDGEQPQESQSDQQQESQSDQQQDQSEQHSGEQPQPEQQQPKQPHEDVIRASSSAWKKMLEKALIKKAHPMLRKVFNYTLMGINVYLCGPAGSGKTTLCKQLAAVRGAYFNRTEGFNFLSVTQGMSESHLLGWRLPIDGGAFKYFPSGFVTTAVTGGVFLLDEFDAGDSNVTLVMNSCLANGMFAVPQRTECPIVHRHADHVVIAAGNTPIGAGPDEMYSARVPVDGSTGDRFQQVNVNYDALYEASLFGVDTPIVPVEKEWSPSRERPTAEVYAAAYRWFIALRACTEELRIPRIVGRNASKFIALLHAGCSLKEAKDEQLISWTDDERRRVLAAIAAKGN